MGIIHDIGKCLLIIINLLVMILGLLLFGFGVWLFNSTRSVVPETTFIPKVLITVGILTSLVYFFGFWGAMTEKRWMLKVYASILLCFLILQVAFVIFIATAASNTERDVTEASRTEELFKSYDSSFISRPMVDIIQLGYECCGYENPKSIQFRNGTYPSSCCGSLEDICYSPSYTKSCRYKIEEGDSSITSAMANTCYVWFVVKALCVVVAFSLSSSIAKKSVVKGPSYEMFL